MALWQTWTNTLQQWQWIGMLLARLSVGLLFMLSGAGKLFSSARREQMRQTLVAARIPVPELSAIFVSSVECVFGALLVVGFLTPLCCLMLTAVMVGALSTTILRGIKARSAVSWLAEFLYLPEVLYVVIPAWMCIPANARSVYDQVSTAAMPPDEPWPPDRISLFKKWIDEGCPA